MLKFILLTLWSVFAIYATLLVAAAFIPIAGASEVWLPGSGWVILMLASGAGLTVSFGPWVLARRVDWI